MTKEERINMTDKEAILSIFEMFEAYMVTGDTIINTMSKTQLKKFHETLQAIDIVGEILLGYIIQDAIEEIENG